QGGFMKKTLVRLSIIAALASTASFAETIRAEVPFDFVVANKKMPAGGYEFQEAGSGIVFVKSFDWKKSAVIMARPVNVLKQRVEFGEGKVVFHAYGDRYFLSEIWAGGKEIGERVPTSRQERELLAAGAKQSYLAVAVR